MLVRVQVPPSAPPFSNADRIPRLRCRGVLVRAWPAASSPAFRTIFFDLLSNAQAPAVAGCPLGPVRLRQGPPYGPGPDADAGGG